MKTESLLVLALFGVAGYFLWKKSMSAPSPSGLIRLPNGQTINSSTIAQTTGVQSGGFSYQGVPYQLTTQDAAGTWNTKALQF